MDLALGNGELAWLVVALLAAGLMTGFLAGLLGIGGGGVLVPVLYETFTFLHVPDAIRMHMVLGTSFAVIVPTAIQSFRSHRAKGAVDETVLKRLVPYVVAGVLLGITLVSLVSSGGLKWVWIVCGGLLSIKMALGREDWRLANDVPDNWIVRAVAFLIGLISTLMSIGGGMFIVTMFTLCGWSILKAVATSSGFGPFIAIPGLLGYVWAGWGNPDLPPVSLGFVSVLGATLIIPMSVLAAPYGVRVAHGISRRKLELAFAAFLFVVSMRLLISTL
ncbi:sulfite exporter TauE/SafE family protein [Hyphomicrobium sp. LHD-15]|uniref:sulfite exporter TauE/SafE family protein n=1 Tax=Hyphomicrobium sp. LHD-15 TaxID=3072142 RepID=UPI00280FC7DF|nr:sulfite exporter TauE/SafE family protein [Hyphomicrobium sp. LHD-15]MDQ8699529.1 sulfite exporter TauE/SafE family protein [Hyphomicrobium sp. LHD-15]